MYRPPLPTLCYPCPLTFPHFNDALIALRPALLSLALAECQPDDADDCVQKACLNAALNLRQFCAKSDAWPSDLARWLRRILRSVLAEFHRLSARRGAWEAREESTPQQDAEAREAEEALALHDELYRRLDSVPLTGLQDACLRRWMGGETLRDIGEALDLSHVMVKYHIDAGAKRLRQGGDYEISDAMWLLFLDCADHATYTKPTGIWPNWMQQHPPDINLTAWIRKSERKQANGNGGRK